MCHLHNTRGWCAPVELALCCWVPGLSLRHCFWNVSQMSSGKSKHYSCYSIPPESLWCRPLTLHVLVTVSTAVTDTMTKGTLERKGFVFSYNSQTTLHHWKKSGREPGGRTEAKATRNVCTNCRAHRGLLYLLPYYHPWPPGQVAPRHQRAASPHPLISH